MFNTSRIASLFLVLLTGLVLLAGCKQEGPALHVSSAVASGTMIRLATWGADAGLNAPKGLAVDSSAQHVIVSDTMNHRIVVFDTSGQMLTAFGHYGQAPGEFEMPAGIDIDAQGNIYVADFRNRRIQKFTAEGEFLWTTEPGPDLTQFSDVAVLDNGDVIAILEARLPEGRARLYRFGPDGRSLGEMASRILGYLAAESGLLYSNNVFYSGRVKAHYLECYDQDGRLIWRRQYDLGHVKGDLSFDPNGNLVVVHTGLARVTRYRPSGDEIEVLIELARTNARFPQILCAEFIDGERLVVLNSTEGLLMVYGHGK